MVTGQGHLATILKKVAESRKRRHHKKSKPKLFLNFINSFYSLLEFMCCDVVKSKHFIVNQFLLCFWFSIWFSLVLRRLNGMADCDLFSTTKDKEDKEVKKKESSLL